MKILRKVLMVALVLVMSVAFVACFRYPDSSTSSSSGGGSSHPGGGSTGGGGFVNNTGAIASGTYIVQQATMFGITYSRAQMIERNQNFINAMNAAMNILRQEILADPAQGQFIWHLALIGAGLEAGLIHPAVAGNFFSHGFWWVLSVSGVTEAQLFDALVIMATEEILGDQIIVRGNQIFVEIMDENTGNINVVASNYSVDSANRIIFTNQAITDHFEDSTVTHTGGRIIIQDAMGFTFFYGRV